MILVVTPFEMRGFQKECQVVGAQLKFNGQLKTYFKDVGKAKTLLNAVIARCMLFVVLCGCFHTLFFVCTVYSQWHVAVRI